MPAVGGSGATIISGGVSAALTELQSALNKAKTEMARETARSEGISELNSNISAQLLAHQATSRKEKNRADGLAAQLQLERDRRVSLDAMLHTERERVQQQRDRSDQLQVQLNRGGFNLLLCFGGPMAGQTGQTGQTGQGLVAGQDMI